MSGLPIMSPQNSAPLSLRDSAAAVMPAQPQGTAAVVKTITTNAVQQARTLDAADAIPRKLMPMAHEKRGHLVGPPPTFEVNVLQHLQETRMLPDDPPPPARTVPEADAAIFGNAGDTAAQDERGNTDNFRAGARGKTSPYHTLEKMGAPDSTIYANAMNISI